MIENFLPMIKDSGEYMAAMVIYNPDTRLSDNDVKTLIAVYTKYLPELPEPTDLEYVKTCLAVDLLANRDLDSPDFNKLGLSENDLKALFEMRCLVRGEREINKEYAASISSTINSDAISLHIRIMLARIAMDVFAFTRRIGMIRDEITELSIFMTSCDTEVFDHYNRLMREVKIKWRA